MEELWKTDGTEAGTVMVKDIKPGIQSGHESKE
jgi:ELWxxDGT repeat protein